MFYFLQNPEVAKFCKGKNIVSIEVTRPQKGWFNKQFGKHYDEEVPPQGVQLNFEDGSSLTIDTWIGLYGKDKPINQKRQLAYLTATTRNEIGILLMPDELKDYNNGNLKMRYIREITKVEARRIRQHLLKLIERRK